MSNIPPFDYSYSNKRPRLQESHIYDGALVRNPWAGAIQQSTAPETASTVSFSTSHSAAGPSGRAVNDEAIIQVPQAWSNWGHYPFNPGPGGILPTPSYHGWPEGQLGPIPDHGTLWTPDQALAGAGSYGAATIAFGNYDQRLYGATPDTHDHETLSHGYAISQFTVDYNPNFQHRLPVADNQRSGSFEVCPQSHMVPNPPNPSMYAPNCSLSSGQGSYQEFGGPIGDESALNAAVTESDLICFGMVSNSLSIDRCDQTVSELTPCSS